MFNVKNSGKYYCISVGELVWLPGSACLFLLSVIPK
uniref:Uncharacterized protein n=1 Tax=Anguilla anguilla TaxID=7936 RepID=A0A0E9PX17_ANGAN